MKNKTCQLTAALLAGSALSLSAQTGIVGWDFSGFSQDGFSSLDGATLTGAIPANFSTNENNDQAFGAAFGNGLGTLYYDGSNGSTALGLNPADVQPDGQNDASTFGYNNLGASGQINALESQGQQFGTARALGFNSGANGDAFTFEVDISNFAAFQSAKDWNFAFVGFNAGDSDNASSIQWEWSVDGSAFNAATTTDLTQNLTRFDLDLSALSGGALDGESKFFLRGTLSGVNDGLTFLDNVAVSATRADIDGSLFILNNPTSSQLEGDWYRTPMGDLFTGNSPWLWSNDYGWTYSSPENTSDGGFVFIQSAPFQTWVFVDAASADERGFWGFAFNATNSDLNGWFFFFNEASTNDQDEFFVWDNEGQQVLSFDDKRPILRATD